MSNDVIKNTAGKDENELFSEYSGYLNQYRNLLTDKIFEKTEQVKNEFRSFCKVNGLYVSPVPDSLEAFEGEKLKLRLTFLSPLADRAQIFLTIFFTSPKEFYLNIYFSNNLLKEIYPGENVTAADLKEIKNLYENLLGSDVYISYYDKDRLTESDEITGFTNFIDIIEQLYKAPRKF